MASPTLTEPETTRPTTIRPKNWSLSKFVMLQEKELQIIKINKNKKKIPPSAFISQNRFYLYSVNKGFPLHFHVRTVLTLLTFPSPSSLHRHLSTHHLPLLPLSSPSSPLSPLSLPLTLPLNLSLLPLSLFLSPSFYPSFYPSLYPSLYPSFYPTFYPSFHPSFDQISFVVGLLTA